MSTQKRFKQKSVSKKNAVDVNEEQKRVEFFGRISSYSDDLLKSELASFSSMGNQQRQNFIGQLIQQDPKFIKDYIKSYLSQRRYKNYKNTQEFYNSFMRQYYIKMDVKYEESKRRELFSEIVDIEDMDEFQQKLDEFVDDGNEEREKFITKLKSTMSIKLFKIYMRGFLNQTSKNSEAYYREFISREDIRSKKMFQKDKGAKEALEEALEEEPTSYELFEEVDLGDGSLFEEEEEVSFETEQPMQRNPAWFVKGKFVQEQEVQVPRKRFWKLYTKQGCPYCANAKKLLTKRKENFINIEVTPEILEKLRPKIGDYNTVPIVLLDDEFIGGFNELQAKLSEIPVKQNVEIFEGVEGFYKEPTKLTNKVFKTPPPVKKRSTLGFDPACYNKQVSLPWINEQVKSVWLGPAPGEEMNMGYVINDNSIANKPILNSNGVTFYKAGRSFYELQCNYYSHKRRQNGFVLTSYDINGNPVNYTVLYELPNKKFVYQDENLFNKQVEYLHGNISYSQEELLAIRTEEVSDTIRNWGKYLINTVLRNNMEINVEDYSVRLESAIYSSNYSSVESYFSAIAGITIFLDSMNDSLFKQRVKSLMYQPETLVILSINEKLPEVFENPNISQEKKDEAARYIDTLIKRQVNNLIKQIVQLRRPGLYKSQKRYTSGIITLPGLDTSSSPDCVKELLARDVDRVNIVYYTDRDGKTYCFDSLELKARFENDDYINVETGNEFPEDFINKVLHLDQYIVPTNTEELPITETPPEKEVKILAPDLLQKILDDIKQMETKLAEEATQEETEDGSEVVENICGYCKEHIKQNTGLKTMINRNDSYELVHFCSEKCFEDIEEWEQGNEPSDKIVPGKSLEDIENEIVTVVRRKIVENDRYGNVIAPRKVKMVDGYEVVEEEKRDENKFIEEVTRSYKRRKDVLPGEEIIE